MSRSGRHQPRRAHPTRPEMAIFEGVVEALAERDKYLLLLEASKYMTAVTERSPFERELDVSGLETLVESLASTPMRETTAMMAGMRALASGAIRQRLDDALADRHVPAWMANLDDVLIVDAQMMSHVFRDGDNIIVGVRWPDGAEMTCLVYIDHNMGTIVKDAFAIPEPSGHVRRLHHEAMEPADAEGISFTALDLADARAHIASAIELGDRTVPPPTSETWPLCRPLIDWVVAKLPAGGTGYEYPEWSDEELNEIVDEFFASGTDLPDTADHRSIVDSLLWFSAGYTPRDPYRWSPSSIEVIMLDRFPRKVAAGKTFMSKLPRVLKAFVQYAHHHEGIPQPLTDETLAAIDVMTPEYRNMIGGGRRSDVDRRLRSFFETE